LLKYGTWSGGSAVWLNPHAAATITRIGNSAILQSSSSNRKRFEIYPDSLITDSEIKLNSHYQTFADTSGQTKVWFENKAGRYTFGTTEGVGAFPVYMNSLYIQSTQTIDGSGNYFGGRVTNTGLLFTGTANIGSNTAPAQYLYLRNSSAQAPPFNANSSVQLYTNNGTDGNYNGIANFDSTKTINAEISFVNVDHSSGTPKGGIKMNVRNGGTLTNAVSIDETGKTTFTTIKATSVDFSGLPTDSTTVTTGYLWFNSTTGAIHRKF